MTFRSLALISFVLLSQLVAAQIALQDSLRRLIASAASDTGKVKLLNQLSATYWYSDPNKTRDYATEAIALSEELDFRTGIAAAYNNMGVSFYQQNRYSEALIWYEKALAAHAQNNSFQGEANVTTNIGLIHWKQGDFPNAVRHYLKVLDILQKHNATGELAGVYDNLGNIFNEQGQYDTALVYYQKALKVGMRDESSVLSRSITLSNIGTAYLSKEDFSKALEHFQQSLSLLPADKKESRAVALSNIGITYTGTKQYEKAERYLKDALEMQDEIGDNDGKVSTFLGLAEVAHHLNRLEQSEVYADSALSIATDINDKASLSEAWHSKFVIAEKKKNYELALRAFSNYVRFRDSISSADNVFQIARLQAGIETERKQAELDLLRQTTAQQQFRRNVSVAGLIALLLIAGLIVSRQRLKIKNQAELVQINDRLHAQSALLQQQAVKLQELDKAKSTFFANISHEFRTPLTLILNSLADKISQLPESGAEADKKAFGIMERNAKRLLGLVNQLLDLSKLEAGQMKLNPVNADLTMLLGVIAGSFGSLSASRNIRFDIDIPHQPIPVFLDVAKFEDILYNLLSNAFKFTPSAGVVSFSARVAVESIIVKVEDSGKGISAEALPQIFNRFYQGNGYYADVQGTGIGLALTKELVELQNGTIAAESHEHAGSVFTVTLPLVPATGSDNPDISEWRANRQVTGATADSSIATGNEQPVNAQEDTIRKKHDKTTGKNEDGIIDGDERPTLLVVEDNPDLRDYITHALGPIYQVITAENGAMGWKEAATIIPDLIISDWMMPEMDGITLCSTLKSDQRTSHIPVIILTAVAGDDSRIRGLENKADDYLTKPFDNRELLARVKNLIETRQQLRDKYSRELFMGPKKTIVTSMDERFLETVKSVVETHMGDSGFSMEMFGRQVGLSRMQLHRKLKALTGQSPGDFIRTMRLTKARQLLEARTGNVSEIGYEVGFNNLSHFSKSYREEFGLSPSESLNQ